MLWWNLGIFEGKSHFWPKTPQFLKTTIFLKKKKPQSVSTENFQIGLMGLGNVDAHSNRQSSTGSQCPYHSLSWDSVQSSLTPTLSVSIVLNRLLTHKGVKSPFSHYSGDYPTTGSLTEMPGRRQIWWSREPTNMESKENLCINAVKSEFCIAIFSADNAQGTRLRSHLGTNSD